MDGDITWPEKQRELPMYCMDSTYWSEFNFRDCEVIIAASGKSETI